MERRISVSLESDVHRCVAQPVLSQRHSIDYHGVHRFRNGANLFCRGAATLRRIVNRKLPPVRLGICDVRCALRDTLTALVQRTAPKDTPQRRRAPYNASCAL